MTTADAIMLGAVQGLTEFLPVSSSGHLSLATALLGIEDPHLLFDVVVHVATMLAIVLVFRNEVVRLVRATLRATRASIGGAGLNAWQGDPDARMAALILIGTVPTGLIGVLLGPWLTQISSPPAAIGWILVANGFVLLASRKVPAEQLASTGPGRLRVRLALVVGIVQGLAVLRGLSRSGVTITVALLCGMEREEAARFSFLLSIPAILGALLVQMDLAAMRATGGIGVHLAGFVTAWIGGYLALRLLLVVVRRGGFHLFAPYCWLAGAVAIWLGSGT